MTTHAQRHVGVLLFDYAAELDVVGAWDVLSRWTRAWPGDGFRATTLSVDGRAVACERGLVVHPHHSLATAPDLDALVHPGGDGADRLLRDEDHLAWLRRQASASTLLGASSEGVAVLAAAGLVRGRRVAAGPSTTARLATVEPDVLVDGFAPVVDDGDLVTSRGGLGAVALALRVVERLAGGPRSASLAHLVEVTGPTEALALTP